MARHTLHARFLRATIAACTLLLLASSLGVFQLVQTRYAQAELASVRAMVSAVDRSLAVGVYAGDKVLLHELLAGLARHPTVAAVTILGPGGATLAPAQGRDTAPLPGRGAAADVQLPLVSPFDASEPLGELQLWLDHPQIARAAVRPAAIIVAAFAAGTALLLLVFNRLAARLLTRPMHELATALAGITPGMQRRVAVDAQHARDEVGIVAHAANQLLDQQEAALAREREGRVAIAMLEARYRGIFDASSAGIFVLTDQGRIVHANPALWRLLARLPQAEASLLAPPLAEPQQLSELIARAQASGQPEASDLELVHADGRRSWVHCMLSAAGQAGAESAGVEGVLYDITRRVEREHRARRQAEYDPLTGLRSRASIEALLEAHMQAQALPGQGGALTVMFIDLDGFKGVNDRHGHAAGDAVLVESARRLHAIFKRERDVVGRLGGDELVVLVEGVHADDPGVHELAARVVADFVQPFELAGGARACIGASVGVASYPTHASCSRTLIEAADAAMYAVKNAGKGGFSVAVSAPAAAAPGDRAADAGSAVAGLQGEQLDPLTGLPARRTLLTRLQALQGELSARAGYAAVLCIDIDRFRSINLAHGAQVGDHVLCETARRVRAALRAEDTVARTGSDEFVALVALPGADPALAMASTRAVIDKLAARLGEPIATAGRGLSIRARFGVALVTPQATDAIQVLQEAQLALRLAKAGEPGSVRFFEPGMMADFLHERSLEEDLRQAQAQDQLRLFVQPQVDAAGRICGGEALLRWFHPERGVVGPGEFIPLAEAGGLIVELGRWILHEGCRILARLNRDGAVLSLAINISPVQFMQPDFANDVRTALEAAGAPAQQLVLEITEGLLLADLARVSATLHELAALGVRFSIDDFGTGYSSLAYLRQLPLHEIKIDRSFVAGLPGDAASAGIVRSILSMGAHLGLAVVAEGVETQAQADFLATHDCGVQQGWLHGRPCPWEEFLATARALPELA